MLLHNSVDMRRPVAIAAAAVGGGPLLVAGIILTATGAGLGLGVLFVLAGLAWGAVAAWLGWRGADGVVQPWNELAVGWAAHTRGEGSTDATPFQDAQGALGEMARALAGSKQYIVDQNARKAEAVERRRQQNEERSRTEEQVAQQSREQASVVESLASGLALCADGDLEFRIRSEFPQSYRKLKDDFNAAMDKLQETMRGIAASALSVRAGANEISQAADDLSRRTEHQAASLEETAAALDQITSTVRKTAEGAREVSTAVVAAKSDAERSGQIVHDAVDAMSSIARSAQEISQIISVIDEIAFQTNLLALNAGVEAARAGDAGRGFAVVASEVRALAQRSAAAAKEIKALISTSTGQVNSGVQLVGNAGQALERILTKVGDISTLMTGIAASTKEQAISLHEVNSSIGQMDHVTQQNAAMVEESTAASFALVSEAQQLTEMIARFQIGAVAQPAPRRPAAPERAARVKRTSIVRGASGGAATARKIEVDEEEGWEEF